MVASYLSFTQAHSHVGGLKGPAVIGPVATEPDVEPKVWAWRCTLE